MPMMRAAHMVMPGTENTAQVFPGTAPVLMQRSPYATLAYEVTPYGASALTGYPSAYPHVIRRGPTDFIAMFAPRGAAMGYAAAPARDPQWARELLNAAVGRRGAAPQRTAPVARGASTTPPATTKPAATHQAGGVYALQQYPVVISPASLVIAAAAVTVRVLAPAVGVVAAAGAGAPEGRAYPAEPPGNGERCGTRCGSRCAARSHYVAAACRGYDPVARCGTCPGLGKPRHGRGPHGRGPTCHCACRRGRHGADSAD